MTILIYTINFSNRLQYICDFIFKDLLGVDYLITVDREDFKQFTGTKINYSKTPISSVEFHVIPVAILFERTIVPQEISCFTSNNYKIFFKTAPVSDFTFDIFAASFYLISRYEEYLPHTEDIYGRFAYENALAFKEEFLDIPLVNIWVKDLVIAIKHKFPNFLTKPHTFKFIPTYDIDIAYSYKHKGWVRNIGGFLKQPSMERIKVLLGLEKDPFDVYSWLIDLHQKYNLQPIYFFLLAARNKKFDKNILPDNRSMWSLIKKHAEKYTIGIHPSWQSGDVENLLQKEKGQLQIITERTINHSRQHYIRFTMPECFKRLLQAGIREDFSMGYGSINGFRASVATTFYWFDLEKNEQTTLKMHPFCFMDANSFFEQKITPEAAFEALVQYYNACKNIDGQLITIWHNNILGSGKLYIGWGAVYKNFIEKIANNTTQQ